MTRAILKIFSFIEDSFPLISGKHTVYFLEKIRYNCENKAVCPFDPIFMR